VGVLDDLVAEATGRRVRTGPVRPGSGGPAGAARTSGIVVELVGPARGHRTLPVCAGLHLLGRVVRAFEVGTGRPPAGTAGRPR